MADVVTSDCRTETGITIGLIDSLITIARILVPRDLTDSHVVEALEDLASDEDVARIMGLARERAHRQSEAGGGH